MKKIILIIALIAGIFAPEAINAAKYKFDPTYSLKNIEQISIGNKGWKWVKVKATGKNANKAIEQAQMDAVAACLFFGINANDVMGLAYIEAICKDKKHAYTKHKKFFEKFFKNNEFLYYVNNVHSGYPTGENNVKLHDGKQQVVIELLIDYEGLRNMLKENNINTSW